MDDRRLLSPAVFDMRIQCQPGSVQSAIGKHSTSPGLALLGRQMMVGGVCHFSWAACSAQNNSGS